MIWQNTWTQYLFSWFLHRLRCIVIIATHATPVSHQEPMKLQDHSKMFFKECINVQFIINNLVLYFFILKKVGNFFLPVHDSRYIMFTWRENMRQICRNQICEHEFRNSNIVSMQQHDSVICTYKFNIGISLKLRNIPVCIVSM